MSGAKRRRRRGGRIVLASLGVVAIGAGAVAATGIGLPTDDAAKPPHDAAPTATATVTRQTLVDTQTETGELSYGDATTLGGRLQGTVTSLPTPGSVLTKGKELYRVDDTPVILLYGHLPVYRALAVDTEGADVRQFEQNLWDLGYRGFTVDEKYTDATATAVKKWQKDLGLPESARTGTVDVGRVLYAADALRVETVKASLGDSAKPGDAVFTYTGTTRGAVVELAMSDQRLAVKDAPVTVKLPDGRTVDGKITDTRTTVDEGDGGGVGGGDGSDAETKIQVTVAFADPKVTTAFDQASVEIGFTASKHDNVLTVPVSALLTLAEGGYGVEVIQGPTRRVVAVQTGMFANGRVEVTGDGVAEGTVVGVPA
ncbi:MAG: peptidoglycan-binding protein [Streptomycetaceae bacterium]|nr:peptidoglycan-binding protein [Streptomycetaceae bacterium]